MNRENNNNRSNDRRQDRDQRDQRDRGRNPMPPPQREPGMIPPPQRGPGRVPPPPREPGMAPPPPRPGMMPPPQQRPGMMPPPNFAPPSGGMEGMPRTAPPNFVPEAPQMERSPMGGVYYVSPSNQRGGNNRPIRRCVNSFTYIWLRNGSNFWFYITRVDDIFIQGFRWRGNRWEFDRIARNRIIFYRCF